MNYQIGRIISYILLGYIFVTIGSRLNLIGSRLNLIGSRLNLIGSRLNLIGYKKKTSFFLGGNIIFSSLIK